MRRGLRARGFFAISTSSGTITVRDQYDTLVRWNGNQRGSSMISTGITGTAFQPSSPKSANWMRVKTLALAAPPAARIACARAHHMRRIRTVARGLQREIGFDAATQVEIAAMEERPATMLRLETANEFRDLGLQRIVDLVEIVLQQDVFRRNGRIGFELEAPMTVGLLQPDQGRGGAVDGAASREAFCVSGMRRNLANLRPVQKHFCRTKAGANCAFDGRGQAVAVQSPARARLRHASQRPGAGDLRRRRSEGRSLFLDDLPGRHRRARSQ